MGRGGGVWEKHARLLAAITSTLWHRNLENLVLAAGGWRLGYSRHVFAVMLLSVFCFWKKIFGFAGTPLRSPTSAGDASGPGFLSSSQGTDRLLRGGHLDKPSEQCLPPLLPQRPVR